jgi:hypothetical protein
MEKEHISGWSFFYVYRWMNVLLKKESAVGRIIGSADWSTEHVEYDTMLKQSRMEVHQDHVRSIQQRFLYKPPSGFAKDSLCGERNRLMSYIEVWINSVFNVSDIMLCDLQLGERCNFLINKHIHKYMTPWYRVIEEPTLLWIFEKFFVCCRNVKFITVFTRARHCPYH